MEFTKNLRPLFRIIRRHNSSSHAWLERQRKDVYKKMSRYDNYRARSAYKLIQIDDKYKFLKPGKIVIEAGAAPGSWTQVIAERLNLPENNSGMCLAIDIAAIEPVPGAICLGNADFTSPFTQANILTWLNGRQANCILSDMAPNATGQKFINHSRILDLLYQLMPFAMQVMKVADDTVFLCKIFDGREKNEFAELLGECFTCVRFVKPQASRGDSTEMYIFCRGFRGISDNFSQELNKHLSTLDMLKRDRANTNKRIDR